MKEKFLLFSPWSLKSPAAARHWPKDFVREASWLVLQEGSSCAGYIICIYSLVEGY